MALSFREQDAILKRHKELLCAQCDYFQVYLEVLGKQKEVIKHGGVENILAYVEAGEKISADIIAIQKVIDPLEKTSPSSKNYEIIKIKTALERLNQTLRLQIEENKVLLSNRMASLAAEIKAIQENPMRSRISTPSYVDIEI